MSAGLGFVDLIPAVTLIKYGCAAADRCFFQDANRLITLTFRKMENTMRTIAFITTSLCSIALAAQTIVITFEGTLNATSTPLDSILVMNLTQGVDTTYYFPDNVLVLGTTGLNERLGDATVYPAMPNPFEASTEIYVVSAAQGDMLLMVHDAAGREVVSLRTAGTPGVHRFRYTAPTHGIYVMSVTQDGQRHTHRLVATEGSGNGAELRHLGATTKEFVAKSDRSAFLWDAGDVLRYIGYATSEGVLHSAAIDDVPVATGTRTFVTAAGAVCKDSPTVTDIDGNTYPAVQIGTQCWLAANLKTTRYSDGSNIPNVTADIAWTQLNSEAWCNYENNSANDAIYGKLYNWYAVAQPNLCPLGWHLPSDLEWQHLEVALGMPTGELGIIGYRGTDNNVGGKMKATTLWNAPNEGATNESGFSGLPGGYRTAGSFFDLLGRYTAWWSATEYGFNAGFVWERFLLNSNAGAGMDYEPKRSGLSVRCVRD
jgi:uncharacterized protein (TIGR02145 family)